MGLYRRRRWPASPDPGPPVLYGLFLKDYRSLSKELNGTLQCLAPKCRLDGYLLLSVYLSHETLKVKYKGILFYEILMDCVAR